jgi:TRAP-type C4-dicarboxylate transport system permease small subunit
MSNTLKEVILEYLRITAEAAGFGEPRSIPEIIGTLIAAFLSLLGVIFLCLVIYGGFLWMTSNGKEEKVLKAKKTLTDAVIGLIIIVSAYGITAFVMNALVDVTI